MGFFGHIPATTLRARYNTVSKRLILLATGDALCYTSAISFQREQLLNGLKFSLNGWVGPITGGETPYAHDQSFAIELPNIEIFPTNTVIFVTANYPEGKTVDIEYFIGEPLPSDASQPTASGTATAGPTDDGTSGLALPPVTTASGTAITPLTADVQLTQLFEEPFQITAAVPISTEPFGTVGIDFDNTSLQLTDAGIVSGQQISWTFNSIQTGETQIIITTRGGGGTEIVSKKVYGISIVLPLFIASHPHVSGPTTTGPRQKITAIESTATIDPTDGPIPVDGPGLGLGPRIPLSWLGFVNIGIKILQNAFPLGVQLLEVQSTPLTPRPVSGPSQLLRLKVIASVRVAANIASNTAILSSTGWGQFGPIETTLIPWLGDVAVQWPITMGLPDSFKLLQAAGFTDPINDVTLRQPLYPGIKEPYYIYGFDNGLFVGVGVNDGVVQRFGSGNLGFDKYELESTDVSVNGGP